MPICGRNNELLRLPSVDQILHILDPKGLGVISVAGQVFRILDVGYVCGFPTFCVIILDKCAAIFYPPPYCFVCPTCWHWEGIVYLPDWINCGIQLGPYGLLVFFKCPWMCHCLKKLNYVSINVNLIQMVGTAIGFCGSSVIPPPLLNFNPFPKIPLGVRLSGNFILLSNKIFDYKLCNINFCDGKPNVLLNSSFGSSLNSNLGINFNFGGNVNFVGGLSSNVGLYGMGMLNTHLFVGGRISASANINANANLNASARLGANLGAGVGVGANLGAGASASANLGAGVGVGANLGAGASAGAGLGANASVGGSASINGYVSSSLSPSFNLNVKPIPDISFSKNFNILTNKTLDFPGFAAGGNLGTSSKISFTSKENNNVNIFFKSPLNSPGGASISINKNLSAKEQANFNKWYGGGNKTNISSSVNVGGSINISSGVGVSVGSAINTNFSSSFNFDANIGTGINNSFNLLTNFDTKKSINIAKNFQFNLLTQKGFSPNLFAGLQVSAKAVFSKNFNLSLSGIKSLSLSSLSNTCAGVGFNANANFGASFKASAGASLSSNIGLNVGASANINARASANISLNSGFSANANIGSRINGSLNVGANLNASVSGRGSLSLNAGIGANISSNISVGFGASLGAGLSAGANLGASLGASLGAGLSAGANLGASLGASLGAGLSAGANLGASLGASLGAGLSAGANLGASLGAGLSAGVNLGAGLGAGLSTGFGAVGSFNFSFKPSVSFDSGANLNLSNNLNFGANVAGFSNVNVSASTALVTQIKNELDAMTLRNITLIKFMNANINLLKRMCSIPSSTLMAFKETNWKPKSFSFLDINNILSLGGNFNLSLGELTALTSSLNYDLGYSFNFGSKGQTGLNFDVNLNTGVNFDFNSYLNNLSLSLGGMLSAGFSANANLNAGFGANLEAGINANLNAGLAASAGLAFGANLGAGLGLGANLGAGINANLNAGLAASAGLAFGANLGASLGLGANLGAGINANLNAGLSTNVGIGFNANVGAEVNTNLNTGLSVNTGLLASANASAGIGFSANIGAGISANLSASARGSAGISSSLALQSGLSSNLSLSAQASALSCYANLNPISMKKSLIGVGVALAVANLSFLSKKFCIDNDCNLIANALNSGIFLSSLGVNINNVLNSNGILSLYSIVNNQLTDINNLSNSGGILSLYSIVNNQLTDIDNDIKLNYDDINYLLQLYNITPVETANLPETTNTFPNYYYINVDDNFSPTSVDYFGYKINLNKDGEGIPFRPGLTDPINAGMPLNIQYSDNECKEIEEQVRKTVCEIDANEEKPLAKIINSFNCPQKNKII